MTKWSDDPVMPKPGGRASRGAADSAPPLPMWSHLPQAYNPWLSQAVIPHLPDWARLLLARGKVSLFISQAHPLRRAAPWLPAPGPHDASSPQAAGRRAIRPEVFLAAVAEPDPEDLRDLFLGGRVEGGVEGEGPLALPATRPVAVRIPRTAG